VSVPTPHQASGAAGFAGRPLATGRVPKNPLIAFLDEFCPDRLMAAKTMVVGLGPKQASAGSLFNSSREQLALDSRDEAMEVARGLLASDLKKAGYIAASCLRTMLPSHSKKASLRLVELSKSASPGVQRVFGLLGWGVKALFPSQDEDERDATVGSEPTQEFKDGFNGYSAEAKTQGAN
jgi:hypothetical protein